MNKALQVPGGRKAQGGKVRNLSGGSLLLESPYRRLFMGGPLPYLMCWLGSSHLVELKKDNGHSQTQYSPKTPGQSKLNRELVAIFPVERVDKKKINLDDVGLNREGPLAVDTSPARIFVIAERGHMKENIIVRYLLLGLLTMVASCIVAVPPGGTMQVQEAPSAPPVDQVETELEELRIEA